MQWAPVATFGVAATCGAICTDILHFPARVLVIQTARSCSWAATLIPDAVLRID